MSKDWLSDRAKAMRRAPAVHERRLWALLRDRRLEGLKFRRQMVIGPYVADFVCLSHRLIVEADGPFHDPVRDAERDAWLAGQNFRVLRFPNGMIDHEGWRVIAAILEAVRANGDAPPLLG
jgi:very-short-patch-repair endonuclease